MTNSASRRAPRSSSIGDRAASPGGRYSIRVRHSTWRTASCASAAPLPLSARPRTTWSGAGSNTPSLNQLELIHDLKPTIWAGMASYGIHLANLAEARGIDLAKSSVRKIIVAAEPLSPAKRQKLERSWGAEVSDQFGMTEGSLVSVQSPRHDGLHVW